MRPNISAVSTLSANPAWRSFTVLTRVGSAGHRAERTHEDVGIDG